VENSKKIAVIGFDDTVLPFKSIGLIDYPVNTADEALTILREIIGKNYGIIYIEEALAKEKSQEISFLNKEYQEAIITIIPGSQGGSDFAGKKISQMVKKAVGMDI
jgi:V/A-type H+-transporting ATPase subunit F